MNALEYSLVFYLILGVCAAFANGLNKFHFRTMANFCMALRHESFQLGIIVDALVPEDFRGIGRVYDVKTKSSEEIPSISIIAYWPRFLKKIFQDHVAIKDLVRIVKVFEDEAFRKLGLARFDELIKKSAWRSIHTED